MDLKEFIQTAVTQIVEGVVAAQSAAAAHGAAVNPAFDLSGKGAHSLIGQTSAGARVNNITFDVAVSAMQGSGAQSGKLQVAGLSSLASAANDGGKAEQVTRLQFSLPICLPEGRATLSAVSELDTKYLLPVDNGDSTWMSR